MLQTLPVFLFAFLKADVLQRCSAEQENAGSLCFMTLAAAGMAEDEGITGYTAARWRFLLNRELLSGSLHTLCLFVCLFVFCQTLILPEGKTAHYANRDSYKDTLYRQQTRTNGCSWRRWRKKTVLWADNEAWTSPRLTGDLSVQLRSSETEFKAV